METDEMSIETRLAAIITLLSSSVLRGATANKTAALRVHLKAAGCGGEALNPYLRDALEQTLAGWQSVDCHPASIAVDYCPLTVPGQSLH